MVGGVLLGGLLVPGADVLLPGAVSGFGVAGLVGVVSGVGLVFGAVSGVGAVFGVVSGVGLSGVVAVPGSGVAVPGVGAAVPGVGAAVPGVCVCGAVLGCDVCGAGVAV